MKLNDIEAIELGIRYLKCTIIFAVLLPNAFAAFIRQPVPATTTSVTDHSFAR
jgi:hypothetical protein